MINKEDLEIGMIECGIPAKMRGGIRRYLIDYIEPGSFLKAVFANDFVSVFARADDDNRDVLFAYANFLYNKLPGRGPNSPWGSYEVVESWLLEGSSNDHT